jgi:carboxyl-terminal processing protease
LDSAELFLSEGTLVARMFGASVERSYHATDQAIWEGALAVLVDGRTMSGGELLAAVLKGAGRATIVGERTAGKGSVQTIYRLAGDYAVQVTTNVLEGPDRLVFNNYGVEPDVMVDASITDDFIPHSGGVPDDTAMKVVLNRFEDMS